MRPIRLNRCLVWTHVVTELNNLSKEINLSFYFGSLFFFTLRVCSSISFILWIRFYSCYFSFMCCYELFWISGNFSGFSAFRMHSERRCVWFIYNLSNVAATANASAQISVSSERSKYLFLGTTRYTRSFHRREEVMKNEQSFWICHVLRLTVLFTKTGHRKGMQGKDL